MTPDQPMDKAFEAALAEVLGVEGGFVDNEHDRGGVTNWGVTEGLARRYGYEGAMSKLPLEKAKSIYHDEFWRHRRLNLDHIASLDEKVAIEVFEQAVNTGPRLTAKRVQECLNVLNRDEKLYSDLGVDGWLGGTSRAAVRILVDAGDGGYLHQVLNVAQGKHYLNLALADPSQEHFLRGWISKRVKV